MVDWDVGLLCVYFLLGGFAVCMCFLLDGFAGGGDGGGFFFFFFTLCCGGCGMGVGFLVGGWVVGFVVTIGRVVAGDSENNWIEKERDKGERDREREEE